MKRRVAFLFLLPGLWFAFPALSQVQSPSQSQAYAYWGFSGGLISIDEETNGSEVDDVAFALMLYGGLPLNKHLALEFFILSADALDYESESLFLDGRALTLDLNFQAYGPAVNLRYPFGRTAIFGSVGMAFWEAEVDLSRRDYLHLDDDGTDPVFSVGFEHRFEMYEELFLRGQWMRLNADGDKIYGDAEVDTFLVGVHFRF